MGKEKEFLVALHTEDRRQVLYQAKNILTDDGAHGVILVNNAGTLHPIDGHPNMISVALELKNLYPEKLIGLNMLGISTLDAITWMPRDLDVLWTDAGGIIEKGDIKDVFSQTDDTPRLDPRIAEWLPKLETNNTRYYGSQLFKYQPKAKNPEGVAKEAAKHFSALITSGEATGSQPNVEKIQQIREWIGPNAKLGIASGMSVKNIDYFLPYADIFIVASSLNANFGNNDDFFHYDPEKVKAFRAKIDEHEKANT